MIKDMWWFRKWPELAYTKSLSPLGIIRFSCCRLFPKYWCSFICHQVTHIVKECSNFPAGIQIMPKCQPLSCLTLGCCSGCRDISPCWHHCSKNIGKESLMYWIFCKQSFHELEHCTFAYLITHLLYFLNRDSGSDMNTLEILQYSLLLWLQIKSTIHLSTTVCH